MVSPRPRAYLAERMRPTSVTTEVTNVEISETRDHERNLRVPDNETRSRFVRKRLPGPKI